MQGLEFIIAIAILIISVIIHEVSHGYAAYMMGDRTAAYAGRLTLNPLKHLDPIGSIIVPAVSYLLGGFIIGWAKPVPYNPYNFNKKRFGEIWVALAGPLSNILLAVIFGVCIRVGIAFSLVSASFVSVASTVVLINLVLAIFNLVPIPPLDGSKLVFALFPNQYSKLRFVLERYGIVFVFLFIFVLWPLLKPVLVFVFQLLTGLGGGGF
jgi:Zn-dependent protease